MDQAVRSMHRQPRASSFKQLMTVSMETVQMATSRARKNQLEHLVFPLDYLVII